MLVGFDASESELWLWRVVLLSEVSFFLEVCVLFLFDSSSEDESLESSELLELLESDGGSGVLVAFFSAFLSAFLPESDPDEEEDELDESELSLSDESLSDDEDDEDDEESLALESDDNLAFLD